MSNIQPGAAIAHANTTNPEGEDCHYCSGFIKAKDLDGPVTVVDDYGDIYCDQSCLDAHEENQAERAHDRAVEAFYSADRVQTEAERDFVAYVAKRGVR